MTIRDAAEKDVHRIAAIWNPVIRDSAATFNAVEKTPAQLGQMITQRHAGGLCFIVAEVDSAVLGFATYGQFRGGVGYAKTMELTVMLAPEAHGQGLGRALISRLEEHAKARGVHSMIAGASGENIAALRFHERLGYRPVAVLPEVGWKFDRWMDLHLMQKIL